MSDYTSLRKFVTGDVIIKCRLGSDILRISINQAPTYDDLCLMMYRVFESQITNPENIKLKYMDNEGDLISLIDDNDIINAISISSLLKITVYDKTSLPVSPSAEQIETILLQDQINDLRNSLKTIEKQMADIHEQEPGKPTHILVEKVVSFVQKYVPPFLMFLWLCVMIRVSPMVLRALLHI